MSSDPHPTRALLTPGADFPQRAIPVTRQPQRVWFRVHKAGTPAVRFGNLSHHRFSPPGGPFAVLYVGASMQTCLWEYFGDAVFQGQRVISAARWAGCCLSQIVAPELKVCAATLERTRDAMSVDKASLLAADLGVPQAWSRAVQEHPAGFEALKYSSRFLDQPCLALFDRDGLPARLQAKTLGTLSELDPAVDWLEERKAALV